MRYLLLLLLSFPAYAEVQTVQVHTTDNLVNGWYKSDLSDWFISVTDARTGRVPRQTPFPGPMPYLDIGVYMPYELPDFFYISAVHITPQGRIEFDTFANSPTFTSQVTLDPVRAVFIYGHDNYVQVSVLGPAVPEPSSLAFLCAAALISFLLARRRARCTPAAGARD